MINKNRFLINEITKYTIGSNNLSKNKYKMINIKVRSYNMDSSKSQEEAEASQPNIPVPEDEEVRKKPLTDEQIIDKIEKGVWKIFDLEKHLKDYKKAVKIRRMLFEKQQAPNGKKIDIKNLPWQDIDYSKIYGACCENVVGYIPIPVGK